MQRGKHVQGQDSWRPKSESKPRGVQNCPERATCKLRSRLSSHLLPFACVHPKHGPMALGFTALGPSPGGVTRDCLSAARSFGKICPSRGPLTTPHHHILGRADASQPAGGRTMAAAAQECPAQGSGYEVPTKPRRIQGGFVPLCVHPALGGAAAPHAHMPSVAGSTTPPTTGFRPLCSPGGNRGSQRGRGELSLRRCDHK